MENTTPVAATAATTYYDSLPTRKLTPHFSVREFAISATAIRHSIDNMPPADAELSLKALCENVLEPLRRRFGVIRITSGYRSERVNTLVGGAPTSQHRRGEAADIHVSSEEMARKMYDYIHDNLPYDQLILERNRKRGTRWIHVSYTTRRPLRRQAFEMNAK